ncbi:protein ORF22 [Cyprinid herpesvirus 1]|uniref:Protein ORF22 n=1 Tax=Cyprinid herpesvirus 1 TaxID=317858 RepID=K7PBC3_9VIRU|nr:protein ORF22 [Cyprinid herpesvirus 1]AFJ20329.1 protein ORF22 [Cyprinid herpesvirus 1]
MADLRGFDKVDKEIEDTRVQVEGLLQKLDQGSVTIDRRDLERMIPALHDMQVKHRLNWHTPAPRMGVGSEPDLEFKRRLDRMVSAGEPSTPSHCKDQYNPRYHYTPNSTISSLLYAQTMLNNNPDGAPSGNEATVTIFDPKKGSESGELHLAELLLEDIEIGPEFDRMQELLSHMKLFLEQSEKPEHCKVEIVSVTCTAHVGCLKFEVLMWIPSGFVEEMKGTVPYLPGMNASKRTAYAMLCYRFFHDQGMKRGMTIPFKILGDGTLRVYSTRGSQCVLCTKLNKTKLAVHRLMCVPECTLSKCSSYLDMTRPCYRPRGDSDYADPLWFTHGDNTIIHFPPEVLRSWLLYTVGLTEAQVDKVDFNYLTGGSVCYGFGERDQFPYLHSHKLKMSWIAGCRKIPECMELISRRAHARLYAELYMLPFTESFKQDIMFDARNWHRVVSAVGNENCKLEVHKDHYIFAYYDGYQLKLDRRDVPEDFLGEVEEIKKAYRNFRDQVRMLPQLAEDFEVSLAFLKVCCGQTPAAAS